MTAATETTSTRRYIRIPAVCEMMGDASRKYVEGLIAARKLRAYKPSRKMTMILYEDVVAFIEASEIMPVAQAETA